MKTIIKSILIMTGLAIAAPCTYAQVSVGIGISASIAPPEIPIYVQPECPSDGYIWTPGYWAYSSDGDGYYWVPGAWVAPPEIGYYWTPCYWAFNDGYYGFHAGYWGPHVGYYGGINYGFGYGGSGYYGGMWSGGRFRYNTAVSRVNSRVIHNTYVNNSFARNNSHYSFNGPGGANARPSRGEALAARDHHINATRNQLANQTSARGNRSQFASVNHGRPAVTAKASGHSFNTQGRAAAATRNTNRAASQIRTNNVSRNTAARTQTQHQNNVARQQGNRVERQQNVGRQQAQQQRMATRQQNSGIQRQQRTASRPQMQQARPQMQQARPQMQQQRGNGGGGMQQHQGGGGGRPGGGGGGEHRR